MISFMDFYVPSSHCRLARESIPTGYFHEDSARGDVWGPLVRASSSIEWEDEFNVKL